MTEGVFLMGQYKTREALEALSDEDLERQRVYPIDVDPEELSAHEALIAEIKKGRRQARLKAAMSEEQGPQTIEDLLEANNLLLREMIDGQGQILSALQALGESFAATGSLASMLFGGEADLPPASVPDQEDEAPSTFEDYRESEDGSHWQVKSKGKWRKATRLEAAEIRAIISRRAAR